ncbi:TBC domain-containing protein [Besnoitia besnoiti]|uniref:TBC domain-containing protein n=1 Tax=Besnoitia besnoiti TaxID=94643 RepID=A0A2A9MEG2_BESBE|nr:TBC domain-containing protein [Besnoitia besnoiti]PFH36908.1 TBC domain-containing protein [Besnoitia besnoiti]
MFSPSSAGGGSTAPQELSRPVSCLGGASFLPDEDDDGLPPLTSSYTSYLFASLTAVPLSSQANEVLASGRSRDADALSSSSSSVSSSSDDLLSSSYPFLRRITWQRYLGLLRGDAPAEWAAQAEAHRKKYRQLLDQQRLSAKRLTSLDPQKFHPLASTADNPWSQKQLNDCLMEEIWKDVERTFADRALFCREATRKALQRILFTWSRQNPDISYKQGMNELLAIFFLICAREQVPPDASSSAALPTGGSEDLPQPVRVLLSSVPDDVEADSFSLFNALMNDFLMRAAYIPPPPPKPAASPMSNILGKGIGPLGGLGATPAAAAPQTQQSAILWRCGHIFHKLLRKTDSALYEHLVEMDVQPQLFLLRWLRLLFSREFHVQDTILIWDAVFADAYLQNGATSSSASAPTSSSAPANSAVASSVSGSTTSAPASSSGVDLLSSTRASVASVASPMGSSQSSSVPSYVPEKLGASAASRLPLTDFFALAMLRFIRENLMASDETLCLRRLLKFPPIESLQPLILLALALRSPQKARAAQTARPCPSALSPAASLQQHRLPSRHDEDAGLYKLCPPPASALGGRKAIARAAEVDSGARSSPPAPQSVSRECHASATDASSTASVSVAATAALGASPARPVCNGDFFMTTPQVGTSGVHAPQVGDPAAQPPSHACSNPTAVKRDGGDEGGRGGGGSLSRDVSIKVGYGARTGDGVSGLTLARHVGEILATLKAAAHAEEASEAERRTGNAMLASSAASPVSVRRAVGSAISRLGLLRHVLAGDVAYSPSLFAADEEPSGSAASQAAPAASPLAASSSAAPTSSGHALGSLRSEVDGAAAARRLQGAERGIGAAGAHAAQERAADARGSGAPPFSSPLSPLPVVGGSSAGLASPTFLQKRSDAGGAAEGLEESRGAGGDLLATLL